MDNNPAQDEFLRLLRAIYDSVEREGELQRQLRRSKEALVSVALRLQVALKVAEEDEQTMSQLIAIAEAAKAKEIIAKRKADEAGEVINSLSIEVNGLKRRLKILENERLTALNGGINPVTASGAQQFEKMNNLADDEVDSLFDRELENPVPHFIDSNIKNSATPFDKWKMNEFLYTPNTPAASLAHDKHVVNMLLQAATSEMTQNQPGSSEGISRLTKSSLAKSKKLPSGLSQGVAGLNHNHPNYENQVRYLRKTGLERPLTLSSGFMGANDYEIFANHEIDFQLMSPVRPGTVEKDAKAYYLSTEAQQSWNTKQKFEKDNLGRMNLWTSHNTVQPHPQPVSTAELPQKKTTRQGSMTGFGNVPPTTASNNVKLKSLRVENIISSNQANVGGDANSLISGLSGSINSQRIHI